MSNWTFSQPRRTGFSLEGRPVYKVTFSRFLEKPEKGYRVQQIWLAHPKPTAACRAIAKSGAEPYDYHGNSTLTPALVL